MLKNQTYTRFWSFFFINSKHFKFFYKFFLCNLIFEVKLVNSQNDMLGAPVGIFKAISKNYNTFSDGAKILPLRLNLNKIQTVLFFNLNAEICNWNNKTLSFTKSNLTYSNTNIFSIKFLFKINYYCFLQPCSNAFLFKDLWCSYNIPLRSIINS